MSAEPAGRPLVSAPATGLVVVTAFNRPVFEAAAALGDLLRRRLSERHALLFATPGRHGDQIAWTTTAPGPIRPWHALSPAERAAYDPARRAMGEDLDALADSLSRGGTNTGQGNLGHLLRAAMEVPSARYLYAVGDQPVLAFWGFRPDDGAAFDPFAPVEMLPASAPARRSPFWLLLLLPLLVAPLAWWSWPQPVQQTAQRDPPAPAPEPPAPTPPLPPVPDPAPAVDPPAPAPVPPAPLIPDPVPPKPPEPKPEPPPHRADIPADRWERRDLSMFKGCWSLGHETPIAASDPAGRVVSRGMMRTGRMCFNEAGQGERTMRADMDFGPTECRAPFGASFDAEGRLHATQPQVACDRRGHSWDRNELVCTRRNDSYLDCIEHNRLGTTSVEFRRGR